MKGFKNALVYVGGEGLKKCDLAFDSKILSIGEGVVKEEFCQLPDDAIVLAGFIDQHIHGAGGSDAMDGTVEGLKTIATTVAKEGTTTFLATTMTQSKQNILNAMTAVKDFRAANYSDGARIYGVHLEGPFIAEKHKGAQPLEYVRTPDIALFDEFNAASGNAIRIVSLAPETADADKLIAHLKENNIVASIGHTGAGYNDIIKAVSTGASNVTHTYNAQTPLHHREIGTVGSAMLIDSLNCEMICDTIHVSVPAMMLLVKNKPSDKLTLITDAMRAKGLGDGESELGGQLVIVNNGEARLKDGTLAGSVLLMNRAVQNLVEKVKVPFLQAVDCATINPAKNLGIDNEVGSINVGKRADFTVINKNYDVLLTVCDGKVIYKAI